MDLFEADKSINQLYVGSLNRVSGYTYLYPNISRLIFKKKLYVGSLILFFYYVFIKFV